jgi:phosphonate transport system substrate-binding protein
MRRLLGGVAALLVAGALVALFFHDRGERRIGEPDAPAVVVLSPDHGRDLSPDDLRALAEILGRGSGLAVEVRVAATPLDAIEAFGGRADVGLLPLFGYLLARQEYGVEAALQALRPGPSTTYAGEILARADGPVRALPDLEGKTIAFVDPYSTSGFLFPAKLLADAGIRPVARFAGGHPRAIEMLRSGEADAAATYVGAAAGETGLVSIVRTEPIQNEPVFFRAGLRQEKRERLARALRALPDDPEGARLLLAIAGIEGFRPVSNEAFGGAVDAIRAAGRSVYDLVPEGIRVESRRRGIPYVLLP